MTCPDLHTFDADGNKVSINTGMANAGVNSTTNANPSGGGGSPNNVQNFLDTRFTEWSALNPGGTGADFRNDLQSTYEGNNNSQLGFAIGVLDKQLAGGAVSRPNQQTSSAGSGASGSPESGGLFESGAGSTSVSGSLNTPGGSIFSPDPNSFQATPVDQSAMGSFTPTTSVEQKIEGLLSRENPLMKLARTSAQQQANSRGLLNSSIAAGAGEKAMIESAMPIAQQDAATENQFALNDQGFGYNAAITDAQMENQLTSQRLGGEYNLAQTGYAGQIEGMLSQLAHGQTLEQMSQAQKDVLGQMAAQHGYNLGEMSQSQIYSLVKMNVDTQNKSNLARVDSNLQKDRMTWEKQLNKELAQFDADVTTTLKQMDISSADKSAIMEIVGKQNQQYMNEFTAISLNPDLEGPTKTAMIKNLQNNYKSTTNAMISMAGFDFDIFEDFEDYGGGGDGGGEVSPPGAGPPEGSGSTTNPTYDEYDYTGVTA